MFGRFHRAHHGAAGDDIRGHGGPWHWHGHGRGPGGPHGHGFRGHGGRGFWGHPGDRGFSAGRKLSSADLQLVILALLDREPAHGYELIRALEARSQGFYTPSPGVIYPALTYLDEIGHAEAQADGNRKLYRITEAGRAHLDAHRATADAILDALARIGGRMDEVREAFAGVGEAEHGAHDARHEAQRLLKHALMARRGCDAAEAQRIATILQRAAAEILGGTKGGKDANAAEGDTKGAP